MFEIMRSMIKEEWRIHSSLFGSFVFAMFPALLAFFAFAFSLSIPVLLSIVSAWQISLVSHYMFIFFGLSVGSFGIVGREIMNRRFGHASLIAYSSRTLPVSERVIFANFFVKDVIYYFFLWIFPFVAGLGIGLPFINYSVSYAFMFLASFTMAFITGLSISFFLSTLYAHSARILAAFAAVCVTAILAVFLLFSAELLVWLFNLEFLVYPSVLSLSCLGVFSLLLCGFSFAFAIFDYPQHAARRFSNLLEKISKKLSFTGHGLFISKDLLDLQRSEGGIGKIVFSFIFPIGFVWIVLYVFMSFMPSSTFIILFAIFLGIIASTIYNWLTEFDLFNSYAFLPVKVSEIIDSKVTGYAMFNILPVLILAAFAATTSGTVYLLNAFVAFFSVSAYTLSVIIYLAGLYPNIMLYNAKIFLKYVLSISPVILVLIFSSSASPFYVFYSALLLPLSYFIIGRAKNKWEKWDNPSF